MDREEHTLVARFSKCRDIVGLARIKKDIDYGRSLGSSDGEAVVMQA